VRRNGTLSRSSIGNCSVGFGAGHATVKPDAPWFGFLMRGLANVRAEFSLTALAYNLRRALNILGVEAMTAAVAA
jgi:hypothetical protein